LPRQKTVLLIEQKRAIVSPACVRLKNINGEKWYARQKKILRTSKTKPNPALEGRMRPMMWLIAVNYDYFKFHDNFEVKLRARSRQALTGLLCGYRPSCGVDGQSYVGME